MAKASPLQIVKNKYGSKEKLIEAATQVLEAAPGEPAEEFQARLKYVSNAKLLHLVEVAKRVEDLGGKKTLAAKVADLRSHGKDKDFVAKLETQSMSKLLDLYTSLSRRQKAQAAKA